MADEVKIKMDAFKEQFNTKYLPVIKAKADLIREKIPIKSARRAESQPAMEHEDPDAEFKNQFRRNMGSSKKNKEKKGKQQKG